MQNDFNLAYAWAQALTGDPDNAIINWRFIHDQDKGRPAIKRRATVAAIWAEACQTNMNGYGIFATVNEMDGQGDSLQNVSAIRAHVVDLDDLNAMANLERAAAHQPAPQFAAQTSPNKAHVYWVVNRYLDLDYYKLHQRKLRQLYEGDKAVIDATRVLRVPGFMHRKGQPHLVTCHALPGYGALVDPATLSASLSHVNVPEDTGGGRKPLGTPEMAAPSREWAIAALDLMDTDGMDHTDFISFTAAWKQAVWTFLDADEALRLWLEWCERFGAESKGREHNLKHWNSITETENGWKSLLAMNWRLKAKYQFGDFKPIAPAAQGAPTTQLDTSAPIPSGGPVADLSGPLLMPEECREYFKGLTFITAFGRILDSKGQYLNQTQFNGAYGGKQFVISPTGAPSTDPWASATRSVFWKIPVVDYTRFLPHVAPGEIVTDEMGRTGVNTFIPPRIVRTAGDPSPFYHHLSLIMPDAGDRKIFLDYIAHNAKFPGHKIPWAPLLQSAEGVGKTVFKDLMQHLVGSFYFYTPKAQELTDGGSKFNAWMRQKLFILVDEIKTDERRDMIEVLKPWISEKEIEIQAKGLDQVKEDNYSNWMFFSNYKDAVPINQNSRRFAIFYSAIQSEADLQDRQMGESYFSWIFNWLNHEGGKEILAHHFMNEYQIERGAMPMRAPKTTSHREAVQQGRTPLERAILDAVDSNVPGFRAGWIGSNAAMNYLRRAGIGRLPSIGGLERVIIGLGYHVIGRAPQPYFQEESEVLPVLFNRDRNADMSQYGPGQGYGLS